MTTMIDVNVADEMQLRAALIERIGGMMTAHAIGLAAELGIADHIGDGTATSHELAAATNTHQPSLARLLRLMAAVGLMTEAAPDQFGLTPVGAQLRSDSAYSLRAFARVFCHPSIFAAWNGLSHTIATGEAAFPRVHGSEFYELLAADPEFSAVFNDAMGEESRSSAAHLAASFDFSGYRTVVDLGGGDGTLLAAILRAHPDLRGIVFDTESGVAEAPGVLAAAGVDDRCAVQAGSFFTEIPGGADLYIIKSVFQDWGDEQALALLRTCRAQMPEHATLVIVGSVVPDLATTAEPIIFFTDMNMLVNAGGRERTEADFRALLQEAGFRVTSVDRGAAGPLSVITVTPA